MQYSALGARTLLKSLVMGPSCLVNWYLKIEFHIEFRLDPPPPLRGSDPLEQRNPYEQCCGVATVLNTVADCRTAGHMLIWHCCWDFDVRPNMSIKFSM